MTLSRRQSDLYMIWVRKVQGNLPNWATRTFHLRGKVYDGCGFHWALERSLGGVIRIANGFENWPKDMTEVCVNQIIVEEFGRSLQLAERTMRRRGYYYPGDKL
jgi:hypothetical protein